ncbi:hypothetical protein [Saccharicrinis sp. FJH54]|uniref:hypothetical protein n=1 Tax=Saccharicrinis sp. FJH54 TaxID=3344665 RepID=UPI0035D41EBC
MAEPDYSKFWWGFLPGIVLPPVIMAVYFFVNVSSDAYLPFFKEMVKMRIFPALVAVSSIVNLIIFYYFMQKEKWNAGRGVILATMLYALIMMAFKFF